MNDTLQTYYDKHNGRLPVEPIPEDPKIKDTLIFDNVFIEKIKSGQKIYTIRNSHVSLGIKKISDDLTIDVQICTKLNVLNIEFRYHLLGFDSQYEMHRFYEQYLKRDYAYEIHFKIVDDKNRPYKIGI